MTDPADVIVCGAGIAGITAAYHLAKAGVKNILLIDERPPLSLTSDRSTECYRNWWPDVEQLRLMNRSIDLMEQLAAESANVFRMNRRGYLYVTGDEGSVANLVGESRRISSAGAGALRMHDSIGVDYIPSSAEGSDAPADGADLLVGSHVIRNYYPYLTDRAVAALHVRRAGWLSAQQLGMRLLEGARQLGVTFRSGRIEGIQVAGGRVQGASLGTGEHLGCSVFVNAAGPFFKHVGHLAGLALPVVTELHLKAVFEDSRGVIGRDAPLLIWVDSQRLPWDDDERSLLEADPETKWLTGVFAGGAHTRPEGAGESKSVLMLWDYKTETIEPIVPAPLDEKYPEIVLRGLSGMLPELRGYLGRAPRAIVDGGYYVKTRENRMLVGPTPVEGFYLLGAVSGFGIMSACAAGELLAAHVTDAALPAYAKAFALSRYGDPTYVTQLEESDKGWAL